MASTNTSAANVSDAGYFGCQEDQSCLEQVVIILAVVSAFYMLMIMFLHQMMYLGMLPPRLARVLCPCRPIAPRGSTMIASTESDLTSVNSLATMDNEVNLQREESLRRVRMLKRPLPPTPDEYEEIGGVDVTKKRKISSQSTATYCDIDEYGGFTTAPIATSGGVEAKPIVDAFIST
ncbi:uncharacterized protein LOC128985464 [Macrosteles quadrilineatus]|uniref:uncharacterized protein LOC128985464 n=1 Tax=Macrosteles quadrilineatus TaxID=74068 RepID=UPI0023E1C3C5|nr:uncharacterized protein LOC128985464 [Macrosteles quadrilineatus]